MMVFPPVRKGTHDLISSLRFEDFEVSWAGPCLRKDLFAFGSEDGRLLFADLDGVVQGKAEKAAPSGEAINGVACFDRWMSVSTRSEVMLWTIPLPGETLMGARIPFGVHGVIVGQSGYFLAPLGHAGLLFYHPEIGREQPITVSRSVSEDSYFYRVISLRAGNGEEIVACAMRRGGVAAMTFKGMDHQHTVSTLTFDGLDVIDLCPLHVDKFPEAAAAVGRDGTIILFKDVLHDRHPGTIKYDSISGTAYRILIARGYLFLLTSEGLYVIAGLIDLFLNHTAENPVTPVLAVPMEAVDANLGSQQWLWIVMNEGALRFDVELLDHITPANLEHGELREMRATVIAPSWRSKQQEQKSTVVLAQAS